MTLIDTITAWYTTHMSHVSIMALMTIESSFIPFPSEVVIPPAAYVAGNPESVLCVTGNYLMDVFLIVLSGTVGAMLGAIINYLLSLWLGRLVIYKFADSKLGHLCLLDSNKVRKAEDYFNEHGNISTFIGRLIPAIRQLISIPAGLAKMPFGKFLLFTFLGAFLWNTVLAILGYVAHGQAELINQYSHELSIVLIALFGIGIAYVAVKQILKLRKQKADC